MKIVLGISFLVLTIADIQFSIKDLTSKSFVTLEPLVIIRIKFLNKKEFAKIALGENPETFVMYISAFHLTFLLKF